jgi:hypothetical protein
MWMRHVSGKMGFWGGDMANWGGDMANWGGNASALSLFVRVHDKLWVCEVWVLDDTQCLTDTELHTLPWTRLQRPHTQRREQEEP